MLIRLINNSDTAEAGQICGVCGDSGLVTRGNDDTHSMSRTGLSPQIRGDLLPVASHTEIVGRICQRYMSILASYSRHVFLKAKRSSFCKCHHCGIHRYTLLIRNIHCTIDAAVVKYRQSRHKSALEINNLTKCRDDGTPAYSYYLFTNIYTIYCYIYTIKYFLKGKEVPAYRHSMVRSLLQQETVDAAMCRHLTGIPT